MNEANGNSFLPHVVGRTEKRDQGKARGCPPGLFRGACATTANKAARILAEPFSPGPAFRYGFAMDNTVSRMLVLPLLPAGSIVRGSDRIEAAPGGAAQGTAKAMTSIAKPMPKRDDR